MLKQTHKEKVKYLESALENIWQGVFRQDQGVMKVSAFANSSFSIGEEMVPGHRILNLYSGYRYLRDQGEAPNRWQEILRTPGYRPSDSLRYFIETRIGISAEEGPAYPLRSGQGYDWVGQSQTNS